METDQNGEKYLKMTLFLKFDQSFLSRVLTNGNKTIGHATIKDSLNISFKYSMIHT